MKTNKIQSRIRRRLKSQQHIKRLGVEKGFARFLIQRTVKHIKVQVIDSVGGKILASACSNEKELRDQTAGKTKIETAKLVGALIAKRAQQTKVDKLAVDRNGFRYHGRVAALVDAAREAGLNI